MLHVHHSNRLERLAAGLSRLLEAGDADPFVPEVVVVQNLGLARWLTQRLAAERGIAANIDFPLPGAFIWRVFGFWLPRLPEIGAFDRESLLWRTMTRLPGLLEEPAFVELRRYLASGEGELKRYQLCRRIADLYDRYLVYRPDWILAWQQGAEGHWQARLWRVLAEEGGEHRAGLLERVRAAMSAGRGPAEAPPARVAVFGLSGLAPAYLEVLSALAAYSEVHVFLLNPSREYWADIVDDPGQARRRARASRARRPDTTGLLDVGNPLLASLGHAGQAFLDQLLELEGESHEDFEAPGRATLLAQLQADVLELRDHRAPDPDARRAWSGEDDSLQVHVCHGPLREVQVLHDRLLALFEGRRDLEPREVVVMAPDIDQYAPLVEAVFGSPVEGQRIPWSVADRRYLAEQPVLEALLSLLALPASRLTASEVLSWLEVPAIQRRLGLGAAGLDRVRAWVRESGVRWGADAAMRAELGLPAEDRHTWEFGLRRLFLGYAVPTRAEWVAGVAPYPDVEGAVAEDLGALQAFLERLRHWRLALGQRYTAAGWQTRLQELIAGLFEPDDEEEELLDVVRAALDGLREQAEAAGLKEALGVETLRAHLEGILSQPMDEGRFLTGRVTFCNLVPMRSIPFRVVCLLGMNDTDFPRLQPRPVFDRMARYPRRGDRSWRQDDRYLFLETLLSAREVLYLSYVGHDARDNSSRTPSVVLGELLDYVEAAYQVGAGGSPRASVVTEHPLQPFSRRYFDGRDPRLFSYAEAWAAAARSERVGGEPVFIQRPLPAPPEAARHVDLEALARFLVDPAAGFLTARLGLRLPDEPVLPEDAEPFAAGALDLYGIKQRLFELREAGRPRDVAGEVLRGSGLLPHGAPGELLHAQVEAVVEDYLERLRALPGAPVEVHELELRVGDYVLEGRLDGLTTAGLVTRRLGRLRAKDYLRLWVRHLALNVARPPGVAPRSLHLAEDQDLRLSPVPEADVHLRGLLDAWWDGQSQPLPFYPQAALDWVQKGALGQNYEPDQPAVRLAFRGRDPLGEAFEDLSRRLIGPLLAAVGPDDD